MALKIFDTLAPQGSYPAVQAKHVGMEGGESAEAALAALRRGLAAVIPEVLPGAAVLEPEKFYEFGTVESLAVELAVKNDGKAHEFWFRFQPEEGFSGLTITPEVKWANEPQYPAGMTCMVGICMGMAVMAVV